MKKRHTVIFGLPAMVLAFSLVLTGCDDPSNESGSTHTEDQLPVLKITGKNISTDWGEIDSEVRAGNKYVILDLTDCWATNNTISGEEDPSGHNTQNFFNNLSIYIKGIILPSGLESIGEYAFWKCQNLTSVTILEGVTSIGEKAFAFCQNLTSVDIPAGVTTIGDGAFGSCGLTSVTIPAGVTSIGNGAFRGGQNLTAIIVDDNNANYSSQDGVLFNANKTTLIQYPGGKSGAYTIPPSVTSIGDSAFAFCEGLISVTIPASVQTIGNSAFHNCYRLTAITVANSNVNYSSQDGVLFNANKTTLIQYPGGKSGAYTIPPSVTSIGNYAFESCRGLTSVTIPANVTTIGHSVFYNCSNLTSVTFAGTISSANFGYSFNGNLREKYLAEGGGAGTYTGSGDPMQGNYTWTKQ